MKVTKKPTSNQVEFGECLPGDNSERCQVVTMTDYGDKGKAVSSRSKSSFSSSTMDFNDDDVWDLKKNDENSMGKNIMKSILSSIGNLTSTFDNDTPYTPPENNSLYEPPIKVA